jgi:hypothetical protein
MDSTATGRELLLSLANYLPEHTKSLRPNESKLDEKTRNTRKTDLKTIRYDILPVTRIK